MLVTTARSAHCQRCTNFSRQYCAEDYIHESTKNKRKIRQDSEAHTRQQTTLRRTEYWAEMPWVGNQNVDSNNRLHEGIRLNHTQINLERPQILRYGTRLHQPPEEAIQRPESISTDWRRKQHVRDQDRNQTVWSSVKPAFQHGSTEFTERRHPALAEEERNENLLEYKHEICWRRPPVCILQKTASKNVVRIQEEYCKSGTQDSSRKDENSQQPKQPKLGHQKKKWKVMTQKIEILTRGESVRYLG